MRLGSMHKYIPETVLPCSDYRTVGESKQKKHIKAIQKLGSCLHFSFTTMALFINSFFQLAEWFTKNIHP